MSIDADDVKLLVSRSLQCVINPCRQWVKNHPRVSCLMLLFFLLYIFLPSVFEVLFHSSPVVIIAAIFLRGGFSCKNFRHQDGYRVPNVTSIWMKDGKKGTRMEELASKSSTNKNDLIDTSLIGETPMKIQEEKNAKCVSNHIWESSRSYDRVPNSQPAKFIGDLSDLDTECQEDDDEDEPHEERNKAVEWTDDDQRNLMDLGTSELERNRRLESLIAKRRARKLLSMQPRRSHFDLGGYGYHDQAQVASVVASRAVEDSESQPGSAPSLLKPKRNPFDIPYDPSEERPILTGGSFAEEIFNYHRKDISFCRHESFVRGPGFMADLDDDPITVPLPSFFPKMRTFDAPGFSTFRRPSDMEENEHIVRGFVSQEDQVTQMWNDSHDQADKLSPKNEDPGHSAEKEFSHQDMLVLQGETVVYDSDHLGKKEADLGETKDSEDVETKECEDVNFKESDDAGTKDGEKDGSIDMEERMSGTDGVEDEVSSSSSSEASGHIVNADKNEAFRNSVRKVLTCLIPRKRSYSNEKIVLPIEPQYDSSPTVVHPTKMEERSFYTVRPFHTPTFSIASDMLVEVSETGSHGEPNSPTDRESLVYDGDVDKDYNSGDEDLWGSSPHPVRLEEAGTKLRVNETGEMGKSRLGLAAYSSHDLLGLPEQQERESNPSANEANYSSSSKSILPRDSERGLVDFDQQVIAGGQDSRSDVSSSSDHLPDQVNERTLEFIDNFVPPSDVASGTAEEKQPEREHPETVIEQEAITLETLHMGEETYCSSRNSGHYNSISDDDSPGRQGDTEDAKSDVRQSRRNSISPAMQPEFLVEPVPTVLSSSSNPVSQDTFTTSAPALTSLEQNVLNDSIHFKEANVKNSELSNSLHQESHDAVDEEKHLERPTKSQYLRSENEAYSTSSLANMHDDGYGLEEVSQRVISLISEANINNETRDFGEVLTGNESLNDLQQEHRAELPGGNHLEELNNSSSPNDYRGEAEEQSTSFQKAESESRTNFREQVLVEHEEDKSIEDDQYGTISSSDQHIAPNLSVSTDDVSCDVLTTANEHEEEAEVRHQGSNELIAEMRHEDNLQENSESTAHSATHDGNQSVAIIESEDKEKANLDRISALKQPLSMGQETSYLEIKSSAEIH